MPRMLVAGVVVAGALILAGCAGEEGGDKLVNGCPTPVHYDDATLAGITKALEALPSDNILHRVMTDYEYERDDLRFCRCTVAKGTPLPKP